MTCDHGVTLHASSVLLQTDGSPIFIKEIEEKGLRPQIMVYDGEKVTPALIVASASQQAAIDQFFTIGRSHARRNNLQGQASPAITTIAPAALSFADYESHLAVEPWLDAVGVQVLMGTLLADSYVNRVESGAANLRLFHSIKQREYLAEKQRLLGHLFLNSPSERVSGQGFGVGGVVCTSSSIYGYKLAEKAKQLLHDESGKRRIKEAALEQLTDISLAFLMADNGGFHPDKRESNGRGYNYRLHTEGFPHEDAHLMARWFCSYLGDDGVTAKTRTNTDGLFLYFGRSASKVLANRIAPFVPPSVRYKLPEHLRDTSYELDVHKPEPSFGVVSRETNRYVNCATPYKLKNERWKFKKAYGVVTDRPGRLIVNGIVI